MTKRLLLATIFFCSFCLADYSQIKIPVSPSPENQHSKGEKRISVSGNVFYKTPDWAQVTAGIKFQLFVSKRISVDADLVAGKNYLHSGPGLIGIPLAMVFAETNKNNVPINGESLFWLGVMMLSLEHVSYHISAGKSLDISPYVSLLRYKYDYTDWRNSGPGFISEQMSFAAGIQLNKYFSDFFVSPYLEYNIGYKDHIPGYNFGIYCGIKLPVK